LQHRLPRLHAEWHSATSRRPHQHANGSHCALSVPLPVCSIALSLCLHLSVSPSLSRCCSDGAAPAHRSPLPPGTSPTPSHMLFLLPLLPLCLSVSVSVSLALSVSPRPSRSLCASSATQPTHRARLPARESVCTAAANSPPRPLLHEWSISPSLSLPLSLTRVLSPSPSASHPQGIGHDRTEALH
jgi:hypothetical protein